MSLESLIQFKEGKKQGRKQGNRPGPRGDPTRGGSPKHLKDPNHSNGFIYYIVDVESL